MSLWPKVVVVYGAVLATAALVSGACQWSYSSTTFRCKPNDPQCPSEGGGPYLCCSDDPAAIDLDDITATVTPQYNGGPGNGVGTPLFSGTNNALSDSGYCVEAVAGLFDQGAVGCPIPCNPRWGSAELSAVCGGGTVCCQTVELEPEDCGFDPDMGDGGCWRPVTGADINGLGGIDASDWGRSDHATHQDPGGKGCSQFVAAAGGDDNLLRECYRRLSVADQRGFCLGAEFCPLSDPAYRDACEQLNDAEGRSGCG